MNIGDQVTIKGERYTVTAKRPAGSGKFFGKYVFILRKYSDNSEWRGLGKTLVHNSNLIPVA